MKLFHEQIIGAIVIAALVAIGLFVAEESELPRWLNGPFLTQHAPGLTSLVAVSQVEWSADGKRLLSVARGSGSECRNTLSFHHLKDGVTYSPVWAAGVEISHVSLSPDGLSVVAGTHSGDL